MSIRIERFGEEGVRIVFGNVIDDEIHELIRRFFLHTRVSRIDGIVDIVPSFTVCLIRYDRERTEFERLSDIFQAAEKDWRRMALPEAERFEIPVRYGGDFGPDMDFVCSYSGLSSGDVMEIHAATTYRVYAIGFMPGFPYLGVLDRRLYVPRQETPVLKVPQGSVGIAQLQTGIYPFDSPAGWRIIGRTPSRLFDHRSEPFSLLGFGDMVRFVPL